MAAEDWALVVGIREYPELDPLEGTEVDATGFYDWVTAADGGAVPQNQARLILSSKYPDRPFKNATAAQPTTAAIIGFFDELQDIAQQKANNGEKDRIGRRLYLYFAGHGFAPKTDDAAILMANATRVRVGHHIPGRPWADWFYKSGYFDEILLFMDCCRENYPKAPLNVPAFIDVTSIESMDRGKRFYAFGTKWARLSRERKMSDGKVRGVFTTALLAGLRHAGDPATGNVTAMGLASWLYSNMKSFLDPDDLQNTEIATEPDIFAPNKLGEDFVIVNVPPLTFPVRITVPEAAAGKTLNVRDSKFKVVSSAAANGVFDLRLARGGYLAEVVGGPESQPFEVTGLGASAGGDGVTHVKF